METNFPTPKQLNDILYPFKIFFQVLPHIAFYFLLIVVVLVLCTAIVMLVLQHWGYRWLLKQKAVFLELTPPAITNKTPDANQHFFSVLHGTDGSRSLIDKLLHHRVIFALENLSTKEQGIRYMMRVPERDMKTFEHEIASHMPDAKVTHAEDYLPEVVDLHRTRTVSFRQTGYFAYPLQAQLALERHDPMAFINGAMTQLGPDELISFQVVVSPTKVREAKITKNKITHNEALITKLSKHHLPAGKLLVEAINAVLFGVTGAISDIHHGSSRSSSPGVKAAYRRQEVAAKIRPARTLGSIEEQLAEPIHNKLQQPLFRVDIRVLVVMDDKRRRKQRIDGIRHALDAFTVPDYQSLTPRLQLPFRFIEKHRLFEFRHRLPSLFTRRSSILSASELADIYHFPHNESTKTENVVKSLSKTLSAPLSFKNGTQLDVVIGRNYHHGITTDIGLTAAERERHVFVVGATGSGKTTLLKYSIAQDIRNGKGVAVIDPHGDLSQELLDYIPEERIADVIYFNPSDLSYPIGLNLLEIPKGLSGDELLEAKDFIAEAVVSIMRKTFSDDGTGGHRIEYILRNAVLTALTVKDATLFTIYDILTNKNYRKPIIDKIEQDWLKNFWRNEFAKAGDYQQVKMMSGVTSKIGRYHASVSAERILSQPKSTIDFEQILNGKILICNLAKGSIGEDTSEVLGISVLAKLQLAAYRRIKQKRVERRPFFAYVDEFQNFATTSFVEMLSEARKYKLFLVMAEQTTEQQDDEKMVNTILTNAGTIICFKSNSLKDEQRMLHLFNGQVDPGEISNLPAYNFYAKLTGGTEPQEPVSGMTIVLEDEGNEEIAEEVVAASQKNYTRKFVVKKPRKKKQSNDQSWTKGDQGNTTSEQDESTGDSEAVDNI